MLLEDLTYLVAHRRWDLRGFRRPVLHTVREGDLLSPRTTAMA
jgi:hypothetical protein